MNKSNTQTDAVPGLARVHAAETGSKGGAQHRPEGGSPRSGVICSRLLIPGRLPLNAPEAREAR